MTVKHLFLFFAALAALASCKKQDDDNSSISGVVIDYDSRQPIAGVPVALDYIGGGGMGLNLSNYTMASATTGSDGTFNFGFNADRVRGGTYRISVNQFTSGHRGADTDLLCTDADRKATRLTFILQRKISVTLRLLHDGPLNADDYISLTATPFPYDNNGGGLSFSANGDYAEQTEPAEVTPGHPTAFSYFTKRDGVYSGPSKVDSVVFTHDGEVYTRHF